MFREEQGEGESIKKNRHICLKKKKKKNVERRKKKAEEENNEKVSCLQPKMHRNMLCEQKVYGRNPPRAARAQRAMLACRALQDIEERRRTKEISGQEDCVFKGEDERKKMRV